MRSFLFILSTSSPAWLISVRGKFLKAVQITYLFTLVFFCPWSTGQNYFYFFHKKSFFLYFDNYYPAEWSTWFTERDLELNYQFFSLPLCKPENYVSSNKNEAFLETFFTGFAYTIQNPPTIIILLHFWFDVLYIGIIIFKLNDIQMSDN